MQLQEKYYNNLEKSTTKQPKVKTFSIEKDLLHYIAKGDSLKVLLTPICNL